MEKKIHSLRTTRVLGALASLREYILCGRCPASTLSTSRFCAADIACTPKYFVFRYRGYIVSCAIGVPYYCSYSHCPQYLGLSSNRNILAAGTPILSVLELRLVTDHLTVNPLCHPECQGRLISREYKYMYKNHSFYLRHAALRRPMVLCRTSGCGAGRGYFTTHVWMPAEHRGGARCTKRR